LDATSRVAGLIVDKLPVERVAAGMKAELVLLQTPFYAESGGQVGDRGALYLATGEKAADVESVFPGVPGLTVHRISTHAPIAVGDTLRAEVAVPLRDSTRRNHTATHLLHASLRQVLGKHVKQAGSVGVCKIVYEGSIAAGVRRIEALTGDGALRQYQETTGAVRRI